MKTSSTTANERIRRLRSSSRCEISELSGSCSLVALMKGFGWRRWWRRRGRGGNGAFEVRGLRFELIAELPGHRPGAPDPTAHLRGHARQLFRSQHNQRQRENDQQLAE